MLAILAAQAVQAAARTVVHTSGKAARYDWAFGIPQRKFVFIPGWYGCEF